MSRFTTVAVLAAMAGLVWLAGCECPGWEPKQEEPRVTAPKPAQAPLCGEPVMRTVAQYLPGGDDDCAVVKLEKTAPEQVSVGQTFEYHIRVTNVSDTNLIDVTVWDTQMNNFTISTAEPEVTTMREGWVIWELGDMEPGQSETIVVNGRAGGVARLRPCTEVTYRMEQVCLGIDVVQPLLRVTKEMPSDILICDPIPVTLTVTNTGTGTACNVELEDPLPEGLQTMGGENVLRYQVGDLEAGQSREFNVQLTATETGTYRNRAVARADAGLRAQSEELSINVTKPELSVTKTGPSMRYVGRPATYTITVLNGPEVEANNTVLTDELPAGATLVSASDGGQQQGNSVVWNLGDLPPRSSKQVTLTLRPSNIGVLENTASVTASCGAASTSTTTEIRGIPAILLEVIDIDDPIEVGATTTYEIVVTNQGSAADTNVQIVYRLPAQQEYVQSAGPTQAEVDNRTVTFAPLSVLQPQDRAVYSVTVRATGTGDVRFSVELTSDQLTEPVNETEATRIYE